MSTRYISILIALITLAFPLRCEEANIDTVRLFNRISAFEPLDMIDLADSALKAGDSAKALSLYMAVSSYDSKYATSDLKSINARIRACLGAGNILAQKCNYAGALEYYIKGLKLSESVKGHPLAPTFYKNIGNVYISVDDYEQGLNYYKQGLQECTITPDLVQQRKLLINSAVICTYLDQPEESRKYIRMASKVPLPYDAEAQYMERQTEGMILERAENYEGALKIFKDLADFALREKIEPRYVCSIWEHLYYIHDNLDNTDSTIYYMKRCEKEVYENGLINQFPELFKAMSEFYREKGDIKRSQEYKLRYIDVRDSIGSERDFNAVKNIQFQYEAAKVAGKIDELHRQKDEKEATIRRQAVIMFGITAGALVLIAFIVVVYRQKRRLGENYRSLYDINREFSRRQDFLETRLKESSQIIVDKEQEIERLKAGNPGSAQEAFTEVLIHDSSPETELPAKENSIRQPASQASKYGSSNLNESLRMKLEQEIADVMDVSMAFTNPDFSLDMLAELVGSNSKYVSQTINEAFDKNFSNFVNDYRVKLASARLVDPAYANLTVKAVGESVGFRSQSSFTAVFRKHTGLTPSIYQKMARKE